MATSNNSKEIGSEEEWNVHASYVVLKFDDEETEEQIEFEDMDNEEEFIEEEMQILAF